MSLTKIFGAVLNIFCPPSPLLIFKCALQYCLWHFFFIAGRRSGVCLNKDQEMQKIMTLGMILKFVTGQEEEPLLGYDIQPRTNFVPAAMPNASALHMLVPTASTCINVLYLPRVNNEAVANHVKRDREAYYKTLDMAFLNDYFGKV